MEFQPEGKVYLELFLNDGITSQNLPNAQFDGNAKSTTNYEVVTREVYSWNKITTCIHNLFGTGNLWADLYGECVINCSQQLIKRRKKSAQNQIDVKEGNYVEADNVDEPVDNNMPRSVMKCKLEFLSAAGGGYWSSNNRQPHELQGSVLNSNGKI